MHEAKPFMNKLLEEVPGFDPAALNKLFDRDEVSNAVLTGTSKFSMEHPWIIFFFAMHLDEVLKLFSVAGADTCAVFNRFDFLFKENYVRDLHEYGHYSDDESIIYLQIFCKSSRLSIQTSPKDSLRKSTHSSASAQSCGISLKSMNYSRIPSSSIRRHSGVPNNEVTTSRRPQSRN